MAAGQEKIVVRGRVKQVTKRKKGKGKGGGNVRRVKAEGMVGLLVSKQKCKIRCRTAEETRVKEMGVDCKVRLLILLWKEIQDKSGAGGLTVCQKEEETE